MTGNAFVVGNGFVVDQGTLGGIRNGNYDAARTFPIRRALDVMDHGSFGEVKNRFHRD